MLCEPAFWYHISMVRRKGDSSPLAERGSPEKPPAATYQACIHSYSGFGKVAGDAALSAYAELYGRLQRKLFAEMVAGR